MAETIKVLGQVALAATTLTAIYTVPASLAGSVSSVTVCNRGNTDTTFRISIAVAGAADATKQYLYYDAPIPANGTLSVVIGITLAATDVLRGYASNANLTMNVCGVEIG